MSLSAVTREAVVRAIQLSYARNDLEPTSEITLALYRADAEHAADAVLAHSRPEPQTAVMKSADRAQKVVESWSDAKRDYAERVTAPPTDTRPGMALPESRRSGLRPRAVPRRAPVSDILDQIEGALRSDSDDRRDEALDAAYVEIKRLRAALELVRDWHDGDLDDGNWDKVISKVREVLGVSAVALQDSQP